MASIADNFADARLRLAWIGPDPALGLERLRSFADVDTHCLAPGESLRPGDFDAIVLSATDFEHARASLAGIASGLRPRTAVWFPAATPADRHQLRAAGAAAVFAGTSEPSRGFLRWLDARRPSARTAKAAPVIGTSPAMRPVWRLVAKAAVTHATVLLYGETGTGKEVVARAIHERSARDTFIGLNCAALPDSLLESELFGHLRGSFTGAVRDHRGVFEAAAEGTVFLDEIAETSAWFQVKLLRVLQEGEVRPLGSEKSRKVSARVIAASNRPLGAEIAAGRFRRDLYYRLAVFPIEIPPLRARREDIGPLAQHFLARYAARDAKPGCRFSAKAGAWLEQHAWPGNVRELENRVQRAVALAEPGDDLEPEHFHVPGDALEASVSTAAGDGSSLRDEVARFEEGLIRSTLLRQNGRKSATARALGITREGLYKKMKRLGIG
ncbi:MAG: sigma-54 dependent transcriptional regulator [Myxococcota bacterium]